MHEVCPFRIGSRVNVSPTYRYADDWKGNYAVVAISWEYQKGDGHGINIAIASNEEIENRHGWTDGFKIDDLQPASR